MRSKVVVVGGTNWPRKLIYWLSPINCCSKGENLFSPWHLPNTTLPHHTHAHDVRLAQNKLFCRSPQNNTHLFAGAGTCSICKTSAMMETNHLCLISRRPTLRTCRTSSRLLFFTRWGDDQHLKTPTRRFAMERPGHRGSTEQQLICVGP